MLTQAWHSWKSARAVFVLAVLALAVGIGSTTAIYSVIDAVMLKPLAYEHGDRFAQLFGATPSEPESRSSLRLDDLLVMRQRSRSFDLFGWFKLQSFNLTSPGAPQHVEGAAVTTTLVNQLGVPPVVGQWFQDLSGAVISHRLWMRLGGQPDLIGSTLTLNGRPFTLVGVAPDRFRLPEVTPGGERTQNDVWIGLDPDGRDLKPDDGFLFSYVRLKPGVALAQADNEIRTIAADIARQDPARHREYAALLDSLTGLVGKSIRPTLLLLFGAAGLLLLITCANVAALFVARSVARTRDTAIHVALGASRRRLARQYFVEGLQVSLLGAGLGVLLSVALVRAVIAIAADFIPRAEAVTIDWRVLAFTLGVAVVASALSSLAPLWQASRIAPNAVLSDGARASAGRGARHVTRGLVIAELALAFTLLAVSGLLIAHLRAVGRTSPGFDPDRLLVFELTMPDAIASSTEAIVARQQQLVESLDRIPGVTGVALANQAPLDGCCLTTSIYPDGRSSALEPLQDTAYLPITPSYFDTLRIPLKHGRRLTYGDVESNDVIPIVINEAAAAHYWPGRDVDGATGQFASGSRFRVIGVVGDIRSDGLNRPPRPELYMLHSVTSVNPMKVFVRGDLPVERLGADVRRAVTSFDAAQPVYAMASYTDVIAQSLAVERVGSFMTGFFAGAALLMAMLGTYGVVAYAVRLQRVEIGTRMALGADRRDVLALVVGGGVRMTLRGLAAGSLLAVIAVAVLTRQFQVRELGAMPFVGAAAIVAAFAAVATFFPAWRATWLTPLVALRDQAGSMWDDARATARETAAALSRAVGGEAPSSGADAALLTEFVDAARAAASNQEALSLALAALRQTLDTPWAMLLEPGSDPIYRRIASAADTGLTLPPVPAAGFLTGRLRFHGSPMTFTSADLDASALWAATHRPAQSAEIATLASIGAAVAVPLRTKRELLGIVLLGRLRDDRRYRAREKQMLRATADLIALMLENTRLTDRVLEQEKLRRDLALAAEVQKRLLPERAPEARGLSLAAVSVPARSVGGDYYDFVEIDEHRLAIALADVAGKGVPAGLIMSVVHASLRVISADATIAPPELAARMNNFLFRCTRSNSYATFFYAQFDDRTRQLAYVNAGHNPPYLVRAAGDRTVEELKAGGTVIGLFEDMTYDSAVVELGAGDVLVVFTDGVPEAMNVNDEEYGEARLQDLVREVAPLQAPEIVIRLAEALRAWTAGATPHDDLTFVVMKVKDDPTA